MATRQDIKRLAKLYERDKELHFFNHNMLPSIKSSFSQEEWESIPLDYEFNGEIGQAYINLRNQLKKALESEKVNGNYSSGICDGLKRLSKVESLLKKFT